MTGDRLARGLLRLRRRGLSVDDDRGSIALLLLVILVGVSLGALLVPMIISQDRTTRFDTTRVQALDAAQAGLDAMLGKIRLVTTGDAHLLPCPASPTTGVVNGGPAQYSVTVTYFTADPAQKPIGDHPVFRRRPDRDDDAELRPAELYRHRSARRQRLDQRPHPDQHVSISHHERYRRPHTDLPRECQ